MIDKILIEEIEKSLSDKFGEQVIIYSSNSIGGGCINHASKIETNVGVFFMKWNTNIQPDIFLREAESLKELKKATDSFLIIPEVFAAKQIDSTPGFLIQEYLPPGNSDSLNDEKLGRGLAAIHKFTNENFGFYTDNYCGATPQDNSWTKSWIEFFRDKRLLFLLNRIKNKRPLPSSELNIYDKLLEKIPQLIPESTKPELIHGDLWSGNFIISEKGPALIDPASYYADREMEFGIITMFGGFSAQFYSAYNEINPLPASWKNRNSLYQLYHVLNHYYLFGGGYQHQALQIANSFF